jgi:hypothetical protein
LTRIKKKKEKAFTQHKLLYLYPSLLLSSLFPNKKTQLYEDPFTEEKVNHSSFSGALSFGGHCASCVILRHVTLPNDSSQHSILFFASTLQKCMDLHGTHAVETAQARSALGRLHFLYRQHKTRCEQLEMDHAQH